MFLRTMYFLPSSVFSVSRGYRNNMVRDIVVLTGKMSELTVDAIVNPTNTMLRNTGSRVSKDLFEKAGKELAEECKESGRCDIGHAAITAPYGLSCKRVIHAVSPPCDPGFEMSLLKLYGECLNLAKGCKSIAFPVLALEQGAPYKKAVRAAVQAVNESEDSIPSVIFVVENNEEVTSFKDVLLRHRKSIEPANIVETEHIEGISERPLAHTKRRRTEPDSNHGDNEYATDGRKRRRTEEEVNLED